MEQPTVLIKVSGSDITHLQRLLIKDYIVYVRPLWRGPGSSIFFGLPNVHVLPCRVDEMYTVMVGVYSEQALMHIAHTTLWLVS